MWPKDAASQPQKSRVLFGGPDCKQPYSSALLNVSGMSYGALSENAILALSRAAKAGVLQTADAVQGAPCHAAALAALALSIGREARRSGANA
jgi:hypothetical protein